MDPDQRSYGGRSHQQHSSSELLSSAKLVAEAAQSTFRHESHKVDKVKVAHAAGDLVEAASQYGKLDEKGFGKYLDKAEDYLHHYGGAGATTTHGGYSAHPTPGSHSTKPDQSHSHGGHDQSGGGYGDYLKLAQGYMKSDSAADSHSSKTESHGDGQSGGGGGFGDYLKLAEGFLKK